MSRASEWSKPCALSDMKSVAKREVIRMTTAENGTHHVTIPNHDPIKLGTLSSILDDIASHLQINRDDLLTKLKL